MHRQTKAQLADALVTLQQRVATLEAALIAQQPDGQPLRTEGMRSDNGARKRPEVDRMINEDRLASLLVLAQNASAMAPAEITQYALEEAVRLTQSRIGYLHWVNADQQTLHLANWNKEALQDCTVVHEAHYPIDRAGIWADSARLRRPVVHNDYQSLLDKKGYPEGHSPLVRHMSVPVIDDDKVTIIVGVGNKEDPYNDGDVRQVQLLAETLWEIIVRRSADERLQESEERFRATFEQAAVGIAQVAPDGSLLRVNQKLCEIVGYPAGELLTLTAPDITHPDDRALDIDYREKLLRGEGETYTRNKRYLRKNGGEVWVHVTVSLVRDPAGSPRYFVTVVEDITERRRADLALERLNAELELRVAHRTDDLQRSRDELIAAYAALATSSRRKDEFLATMSHEFRTPLMSIMGLAELLKTNYLGMLTERQEKAVGTIEESGRHLLALINDILDLTKIEAGRMELHLEDVSVDELCQSSLRMVAQMALERGHTVHYALQPGDHVLRIDKRRVTQILVNLLSNAIKFTARGRSLGLQTIVEPDRGVVAFTVWDQGIGIAAQDLGKLFQPFVQVDNRLAREQVGTGLGLVLVQRLADLHGGSVCVTSVLGQGSHFTVSLPVAWIDGKGTLPSAHALAPGTQPRLTILLADDNLVFCQQLREALSASGHTVVTAHTCSEAVEEAQLCQPDLIFLDIEMPGIDGLEAARRIRSLRDTPVASTPIIVLTALCLPGDRERSLAAGATDYWVKPLTAQGITAAVETHTLPRLTLSRRLA